MADGPKGQQEFPGEEEGFSDPVTGPPKFRSGNISRTFTVGDTVNIALPQDAVFDGSGLSYEWSTEPAWAGSGLVYDDSNHTITGTARLKTPGRQTVLRGNWRAVGEVEDAQFEGGVNYDQLRVVIRINPTNPLRLAVTPALEITHGDPLPARAMGAASGGTPPYRYSIVPLPGSGHPALSALGIAYDPATNRISSAGVRGAYRKYVYQHRVFDRFALEPIGQTFYVTVRPAPRPAILLNAGQDVVYDTAEVGAALSFTLPFGAVGGTAPRRWTFSMTLPAGVRFTQTGAGGRTVRIFGTPTVEGTFEGTWTVTDALNQTSSVAVRIVVSQPRRLARRTWTFIPGQRVDETLPELTNPRGSVAYSVSGTEGLSRLGLTANGPARTLSGRIPLPFPAGTLRTSFWQSARDSHDRISFPAKHTINIRLAALEATPQADIVVREGRNPRARIAPFTGGVGNIRYTLSGAGGSGLNASNQGTHWEIRGTAAQVGPSGRTFGATLTGTDDANQSVSTPVRIRITDTPAPPPFSLPDQTITLANGATGSRLLARAEDAGGPITSGVVYTAARVSGEPASVVSISGRTITFNAGDRAARRQAVWTRTATASGGRSATATVTVVILARLEFPAPGSIHTEQGVPVPDGRSAALRARGGAGGYGYTVEANLDAASGLVVQISGSTAVVSGTPLAAGTYTARLRVTDGEGSTADATLRVFVDSRTQRVFRFLSDSYRLTAVVGEQATWEMPRPVDADGGIQSMRVSPPLPASLGPPELTDDDRWLVSGPITADPGETTHTLIATDASGAEADTELVAAIADDRDPEVLEPAGGAGCGPIVMTRTPRSNHVFAFGSVLPVARGELGPIKLFRPSAFAAAPGTEIAFDWEVDSVYRNVPILEVDLWRTDPVEPYCSGIPNIRPTLSVEREITSGYAIRLPNEPGVYLYRLVALRGGSGGRYLSADWWDCTVLVTTEANAVHISASKTAVPEDFPVVLQWGFKGRQPDGDISILAGPPRVAPTPFISARSTPPAATQGGSLSGTPTGGTGTASGGGNQPPGDVDVVDGSPQG